MMVFSQLATLSFFVALASAQDSVRGGNRMLISDPRSISEKQLESCSVKEGVERTSQYKEDEIIFDKFYSKPLKCGGTVLEIGGFDGKTLSNSWFFEHALGWQSILIEAFPDNYEKMVQNRPNAINVGGAMCMGESVEFSVGTHPATGGATGDMSKYHQDRFTTEKTGVVTVPCKNLAAIFRQHKIQHIDLFFLDVEGAELTVLQTIDWLNIKIDMFVVELNLTDELKDAAVRAVLKSHGYVQPFSMLKECQSRQEHCINNEIFVLPEVATSLSQQ